MRSELIGVQISSISVLENLGEIKTLAVLRTAFSLSRHCILFCALGEVELGIKAPSILSIEISPSISGSHCTYIRLHVRIASRVFRINFQPGKDMVSVPKFQTALCSSNHLYPRIISSTLSVTRQVARKCVPCTIKWRSTVPNINIDCPVAV